MSAHDTTGLAREAPSRRRLGATGLEVSSLGLGAGPLGQLDTLRAERLVHEALDLGISVFDTAPSYGTSEDSLGRALAGARRARAVLVTKGGYGVDGVPDWTPEVITAGVARALRVLHTDVIDVFLLHSCDAERLARGDLTLALVKAKEAGLVRAIGYSGDGEGLRTALGIEAFDVVEPSVNVLDREALSWVRERRVGVLGKRTLANAPWSEGADRSRPDVAEYARRLALVDPEGTLAHLLPLDELFVRFAAHAPGVSCALVGTSSGARLRRVVAAASRGPLPADLEAELERRYAPFASALRGVV
jgi:aryl-alcohol dehydrogenase-like predicted oxidoreductase